MVVNEEKWVKSLTEIKHILDDAKVTYWLDLGTLLGAVRDGKFIPWDTDIDLGMLCAEGCKVIARIEQFEERGFKVDITDFRFCISRDQDMVNVTLYRIRDDMAWDLYYKEAPKFKRIARYFGMVAERIIYKKHLVKRKNQLMTEKIVYTLVPSFATGAIRKFLFEVYEWFGTEYCALAISKSYYLNRDTISFYGMTFNVPSHVHEYLSLKYGKNWIKPEPDYTAYSKDETRNYSFDIGRREDLSIFKCLKEPHD